MEFNPKAYIFLIFSLLILFSGCTQLSPSFSKTAQVDIKESTPIQLSGQQIISKPGYYQFENDAVPSKVKIEKSGTCIYFNIQSPDVVIDGMGHALDGSKINPPCSYSIAFYLGDKGGAKFRYTNVNIKNVTVSHWTNAFQVNSANNFHLENTEMYENNVSVEVHTSSDVLINNNSVVRSKFIGIVGMDNENVIISNNTISNNGFYGVNIMGQMMTKAPIDITVLGQRIQLFSEFLRLEKRTSGGNYTISHNVIENNVNEGILISDSASNDIRENLIDSNSQNGIHLIGVDNSIIKDNTFINNGASGIRSESRGIGLIFENNTFFGNKGTIKTTYSTFTNVPPSAIFGTIIIYLLSIFAGSETLAEKVGIKKSIYWILKKFQPIEEKISFAANSLKISFIFKNNIAVSLIGAVVFGAAFTFTLLSSFGLKVGVFATLTFIGGIVVIVPRTVQYLAAKKFEMSAEYRLWWGGMLVVFLTSALLGAVYGQPVRTAINREDEYEKKKLSLVMLAGPLVSFILSLSFLLIYLLGGTYTSLAWVGLNMSLLSAVVSLIPTVPLEGERVYKWNKVVWAAIFIPILLAYGYFVVLQ